MSYALNQVVLLGRLTREPETKTTQAGKQVTKVSLAVDDGKDSASFFDCVAFDKTADIIARYTSKGKPIIVQGRLKQNRWQDPQSGQNRSKVGIVITEMQFLPTPKQQQQDGQPGYMTGEAVPTNPSHEYNADEDDIPF